MKTLSVLKSTAATALWLAALASGAYAAEFDVPGGDLASALNAYSAQSGVRLVVLTDAVRGIKTRGVKGDLPSNVALSRILTGTGFVSAQDSSGGVMIVPGKASAVETSEHVTQIASVRVAAAASAAVETVVVTSSKIKGDIQTVPIAITALSQEQLTSRQIAGGPDLVKEVPNLTFSKTNFSGYNLEIRGIGTQAISVTTDPAVAVALNDTPFIRNHFFEQEFYDVNQVEVLRGPQGTLYGRNATAGVVNVISAKPTDQFEAMLSADIGNYNNRRFEGMVNIPITDDRLDLRIAGEWTKRDGYTRNETTGNQIDGRDLWSTRVTLGWHPDSTVQAYLVWEHFSENDDRLRSGKQLCKRDPGPASVDDVNLPVPSTNTVFNLTRASFSQGCLPTSMYSADAFGVPYGAALPFISGATFEGLLNGGLDPYKAVVQSRNLRDIQSAIEPKYVAKNDTLELNVDYQVTPALTFTSATGYNNDFLWSSEDYNRFDTQPAIFNYSAHPDIFTPDGNYACYDGTVSIGGPDACTAKGLGAAQGGIFCDPQLGCSDRLVVQDLSDEHAWQLSQEFRLASNFSGPFNFSLGGNYLHYETEENYYVFSNTFTMISIDNIGFKGVWDPPNFNASNTELACQANGLQYRPARIAGGVPTEGCQYIDPNPITSLNDKGHNYFLSQNPYTLNSYAGFGEAYYNVASDLKLIAGARWTDDQKHFLVIPSWLVSDGYGYPITGIVDQKWQEWTGRFAANWTPKLDFTNQTLVYASLARGYKAGGANPPGPVFSNYSYNLPVPTHPLTFNPEFINAYELGTKNTLFDGALTVNGDIFYYDYKDYQVSEIVDRTALNFNYNAKVHGAELESMWEPLPGLKFNFAGGYEDTRINNGQSQVDLMDRTAGHSGWMLMRPFVTESSNCVLPVSVVQAIYEVQLGAGEGNPWPDSCAAAYFEGLDPVTRGAYYYNSGNPYYILADQNGQVPPGGAHHPYPVTISRAGYPTISYPGFDPSTAPNGGAGFSKNLGGNQLPNAPHFTASLSGEYTMPVSEDWAATLHSDFYWQSQSMARVFNDRPFDKIRGYSNVNLALILTSASGWQVIGYLKNVFDTTAITGTFLNSDDSGLTNNIFLTDPRLFGVRVTKNW